MTDDEWMAFNPAERRFAQRWIAMSDAERDEFSRQLLAAIEVLERFRAFEGPDVAPPEPAGG
jgi:hypothetical protein